MQFYNQLLYFLFIQVIFAINTTSRVDKRQDCNNVASIIECTEDYKEAKKIPKPISKRVSTKFTSKFSSACKYEIENRIWIYQNEELVTANNKQESYTFQPFVLENGEQVIDVVMNGISGGKRFTQLTAVCYFNVYIEKPKAVIVGGGSRTLTPNTLFEVDGQQSIDNEVQKQVHPPNLNYRWSCKILKGNDDYCNTLSSVSPVLHVPESLAKESNSIEFTLSVQAFAQAEINDTGWDTTTQVVNFINKNAKKLSIVCRRNCPEDEVNPKRKTQLLVKCEGCFGTEEFEWSVDDPSFDYTEMTKNGRNKDDFIILRNKLQSGKTYNIKVHIVGSETSMANFVLTTLADFSVTDCIVTPPQGEALTTKFKVNCKTTGSIINYAIYTVTKTNKKIIVLQKETDISNLEFTLPANVDTFLKVEDSKRVIKKIKLNVTVKPLLPPEDSKSVLDKSLKLLDKVKSATGKDFIETLNVIAEELQMHKNALKGDGRKQIFKKLDEIPVDSLSRDELISFATLINRINDNNVEESKAELAEITTRICKKAADANYDHIKKNKNPTLYKDEVKENIAVLMSCPEHDTSKNKPALDNNETYATTTEYPVYKKEQDRVESEDYGDYDDLQSLEKKKQYKMATVNFVHICITNAKTIVLTIKPGEPLVTVITKKCGVAVLKDRGDKIAGARITFGNVSIVPSLDLKKKSKAIIDVMICTWSKPLYWWKKSSAQILSQVVFLRFMSNNNTEVHTFKKPFELTFNVTEKLPFFQQHKVDFPGSERFDNDNDISIVRVEALPLQSFFIKFHTDADDIYDVCVTHDYKVTLSELRKMAVTVTNSSKPIYVKHKYKNESWYLVSFVQNSKMPKFKKTVTLSVYTLTCSIWNNTSQEWDTACEGLQQSNLIKIHCKCNHLTIFGAVAYNNTLKIDNWVIKPDFEMVLSFCPILLIMILILLAVYCYAIIIVLHKEKIFGTRIFALGDLKKNESYHYVIQVRTGSTGTSSNICIRIYGENERSKSHLLNYPDPENKILQRNATDWFVITTDHSLGDIEHVALWGDCSGRRPFWYCKDISVYDLQTNQKWYFRIEEWIRLPPEGKILLRSQQFFKEKKTIWLFLRWLRLGWNIKLLTDLGVLKTCTILLSGLLLIYFFALLLYGMPLLQLNDIFENYTKFYPNMYMIFAGIVSSILSFLVHIAVIYVFHNRIENSSNSLFYKLTIVSWSFLIFNIFFTVSMLLVFGIWLPEITSYYWLTAVIEALILFLLFLRTASQIYFTYISKEANKEYFLHGDLYYQMKQMTEIVKTQIDNLYQHYGDEILRPFFRHLYRLIDDPEVEKKKRFYAIRAKLIFLIEDLIMFTIYLLLLYMAILSHHDYLAIIGNKEMIEIATGKHGHTFSIDSVYDFETWYQYMNETVVRFLQTSTWYGKYVVLEPGLLMDFSNKYIGVVRIRQVRSPLVKCQIPKMLKSFYTKNTSCFFEHEKKETQKPFGLEKYKIDRMTTIWNYTSSKIAGNSYAYGTFGSYSSGGYISSFGRTMYNSYVNLNFLNQSNWFDEQTRAIFIEFLTYNTNSNLFSSVQIIFEKSVSGLVQTDVHVNTKKILYEQNDEVELIIYLALFVIINILLIKVLVRWIKHLKLLIWKDLWSLVDFLIVWMSYATFILFGYEMKLVMDFVQLSEKSPKNEFINYFALFELNYIVESVAALLVFIATIRLWKLVRFGRTFKVMETTIFMSFISLASLFILHGVLLLAFMLSMTLLVGDELPEFKSVPRSLITVMLYGVGMRGRLGVGKLYQIEPTSGPIFYCFYMISTIIMITMYGVVLMASYYEARVMFEGDDEFSVVTGHVSSEFRHFSTLIKSKVRRLRGGERIVVVGPKVRYVTPKTDAIRYANSEFISKNKLDLMQTIVDVLLKSKNNLSKQEKMNVMYKISIKFLNEVEVNDNKQQELFFSKKTSNSRIEFVPDEKLLRIAELVEMMINRKWRLVLTKESIKKLKVCYKRSLNIIALLDSITQIFRKIQVVRKPKDK